MGLFDFFKKKKEEPKDIVLEATNLAFQKKIITEEEYHHLIEGYNKFEDGYSKYETEELIKKEKPGDKDYKKAGFGLLKLPVLQDYPEKDFQDLLSIVHQYYTNPNITEEDYRLMAEKLEQQSQILTSLRILKIYGDLEKNIEEYAPLSFSSKKAQAKINKEIEESKKAQKEFEKVRKQFEQELIDIKNSEEARKVHNDTLEFMEELKREAVASEMENEKSGKKK